MQNLHLLSASEIRFVDATLTSLVLHVDMTDSLDFRNKEKFLLALYFIRVAGLLAIYLTRKSSKNPATRRHIQSMSMSICTLYNMPYVKMPILTMNSTIPNNSFVVQVFSMS